jgi:SEC-C motif-containing protein
MSESFPCPCGSGLDFSACCEPLITGSARASGPEALMRSRYTAFARQEIPYLARSLHPSQRHDYDEDGSARWARESTWQGLEIVKVATDAANGNRGTVEFKAHYRVDGVAHVHHELAEFRRTDGIWYYYAGKTVGPAQYRRDAPKVGRNEPCPCGSGRKYKKCCGRAGRAT